MMVGTATEPAVILMSFYSSQYHSIDINCIVRNSRFPKGAQFPARSPQIHRLPRAFLHFIYIQLRMREFRIGGEHMVI